MQSDAAKTISGVRPAPHPQQVLWAPAGREHDTQPGHSIQVLRPQGRGFPQESLSRQITPPRPGATVFLTEGMGGQTKTLATAASPKEVSLPTTSMPLWAGISFGATFSSLLPRDGTENTRSPGSHVAVMTPVFLTVCYSLTQFLNAATYTYRQAHSCLPKPFFHFGQTGQNY